MKASTPKGVRDLGPEEVSKRDYITNIIKSVFQLYGYQPLETPAIENLDTLTGKYGEEGSKLLFNVLNSGDLKSVSKMGLRYDLTVPFARYVAMNRNELNFPFKRYQIQPVWRADRPQKGRYREFYQCDADVIGSNSLLLDAEMVMMIADVFERLQINVTIRINNRKILDGLCEYIGETENNAALATIIDKLDKIGLGGVEVELTARGFDVAQIEKVKSILSFEGSITQKIEFLESIFSGEKGAKGIAEIKELFGRISQVRGNIDFDLTLARGLSYYTGAIYEVVSNEVKIGSILGGGRYDDLTNIFGLPNMSGVGISFGLDRIYDVMTELDRFPSSVSVNTQLLFIPFDVDAEQFALNAARQLRAVNIRCEVYPDLCAKIGKKFKYADNKRIPYVAVIGSNEMAEGGVSLKNMVTSEQRLVSIQQIISELAT